MGEKLKIEYVSIDSIMPYAKNAKEHPRVEGGDVNRPGGQVIWRRKERTGGG